MQGNEKSGAAQRKQKQGKESNSTGGGNGGRGGRKGKNGPGHASRRPANDGGDSSSSGVGAVIERPVDDPEGAVCLICAETIDHVNRLSVIPPCGHNDTCSTCALRLRFIHKDLRCPTCNVEFKSGVVVPSRHVEWDSVRFPPGVSRSEPGGGGGEEGEEESNEGRKRGTASVVKMGGRYSSHGRAHSAGGRLLRLSWGRVHHKPLTQLGVFG